MIETPGPLIELVEIPGFDKLNHRQPSDKLNHRQPSDELNQRERSDKLTNA